MTRNWKLGITIALNALSHVSPEFQYGVDGSYVGQSKNFDADANVKFLHETLQIDGVTLEERFIYSIIDSAKLNFKIVRDARKPLVGHASHKHDFEVNCMIQKTAPLRSVISSVHYVITFLKGQLRISGIVCNMTELKPIMDNETRFSEKYSMLKRFGEIRDPFEKKFVICNNSCKIDGKYIVNDYFIIKYSDFEPSITNFLTMSEENVSKCFCLQMKLKSKILMFQK